MAIILSGGALLALLWFLPSLVPALGVAGAFQALRAEVVPLFWRYLPVMFAAELLAAPILAGIGTWLGMRPQLRAQTLTQFS